MPRKAKPRNKKLLSSSNQNDFTIEECANAVKLTQRIRKPHSNNIVSPDVSLTWDQLADDDVEVTLSKNEIGLIHSQATKKDSTELEDLNWYPEIVWYLISNFIRPEWVGTFALINKNTYAITKTESFWRKLYMKYCTKNNVPEKLRLENDYKVYGLQQRVIRALYHSYNLFRLSALIHSPYFIGQDKRPYELIRRRCISMWYKKNGSSSLNHWSVYFKLKRNRPVHRINGCKNFLQEMDRIDANDEDGCKVLEVTCQSINITEPIFGLTLSTVNISLTHNFTKHKLQLGFTSSGHNVCKQIIPEQMIEIHGVSALRIMDWWHPDYPHSEGSIPLMDEGQVLDKDFFS